ncbi:hypothetical protein CMI37_32260 [Candidatus Pacearchaeota archaeon]|nr:hypothetical protein [Candidatus Pacearchaeota archaeon]|tara:strand:- start:984 stop:1370 length:387 start_codon:yes stop_codon:yes gene_type:complete
MGRSEATYFRVAGTHTNVGTSEETTLQLPVADSPTVWLLVSFHYVQTGGTGNNYAHRLGQTAAWTSEDINERLGYSSSTVDEPINDVFATPIPCLVAADGKLYFRPGFDSSSDNDGNYEFWFKKARGS